MTGVRQDGAGVTVIRRDGGEMRADLLVGADGIHSTVRRGVWPDTPEPVLQRILCWRGVTEPGAVWSVRAGVLVSRRPPGAAGACVSMTISARWRPERAAGTSPSLAGWPPRPRSRAAPRHLRPGPAALLRQGPYRAARRCRPRDERSGTRCSAGRRTLRDHFPCAAKFNAPRPGAGMGYRVPTVERARRRPRTGRPHRRRSVPKRPGFTRHIGTVSGVSTNGITTSSTARHSTPNEHGSRLRAAP
ncbi:FAD-dependent monooxygenase [Actinomadura luteofluorescens]|uniref:FAD-dependent monooxygenase n=1 Tax=Actinomadura luteofluorescens TaxID=46163 RepID=UPI003D90994B